VDHLQQIGIGDVTSGLAPALSVSAKLSSGLHGVWLFGRSAGTGLTYWVERRAILALSSQLAPAFGQVEEYLFIFRIGAFLGLLIAFNGPV
jgi:hypothetical protein